MAIVSGLTGFQTIGVTYTARVDNLYESSGITNNTYFRSLDDGFAYYKDNSGNVIGVFDTGDVDITRVQPGTNITTGGTANEPVVNLADDIVLNSISATTISGGTIYSGGTDISSIFSLAGSDTNFANADLTVDADRTHDMAGYDMKFNLFSSTGQFILSSGQGGYGNFNFIPYSTSSGGVARIDNGLSYIQFRANYGAEVNKLSINKTLNASSPTLGVKGTGSTSGTTNALFENDSGTELFKMKDDGTFFLGALATSTNNTNVAVGTRASGTGTNSVAIGYYAQASFNESIMLNANGSLRDTTSANSFSVHVGGGTANVLHLSKTSDSYITGTNLGLGLLTPTARFHVKGTGSNSATTTALFENSSGIPSLRVDDAGNVYHQGGANINFNTVFGLNANPSGTGQYNTVFGNGALQNATTATSSVAIGYGALNSITFGNGNIAIGREAGFNVFGGGESNVLIGYQAGYNITSGDNHVAIGAFTAPSVTSASHGISIGRNSDGNGEASIAIGYQGQTSANYSAIINTSRASRTNSTANSLEVYVDNVGTDPVFKVGQTSDSYYGGSGNFGIGTINPTEKLDVQGNNGRMSFRTDTSSILELQLYNSATTGTTYLQAVNDESSTIAVGIQGSDPQFGGYLGSSGDTFVYASSLANDLNIINQRTSPTQLRSDNINFWAGASPLDGPAQVHIHGSGATRGYVGIGTETPTEKLEVSGNTKISGSLNIGTILSGTPLINLGLDSSGNVVTGTTGGLGDITRVQPGTNITTGGTANEPVVNLADDIVLNSISATTISGGTIYSGGTDLYDIFAISGSDTNIGDSNLTITDATRKLIFGGPTTSFAFRNSGDTSNLFKIQDDGWVEQNPVVVGTGDNDVFLINRGWNSASQGVGINLNVTGASSSSYAYIKVRGTMLFDNNDSDTALFSRKTGTNSGVVYKGQIAAYTGLDYHYASTGAIAPLYNVLAASLASRLNNRYWTWGSKLEGGVPATGNDINVSGVNEHMRLHVNGGNLMLGTTSFGTNAEKTFVQGNGVAPTTQPADAFQLYSDDVVAGNAAPHFITEAGDTIKLYSESAVTTSQGIADALTNLGFLETGSTISDVDITRVQPGTNITTGGTANEPVVNLADNIVLNSISATTISGGTIYIGTGATIANETPAIIYNQQMISAQGGNNGEITYAPFRWGQVATNQYTLYGTDETGAIQSNDLGDSSTNTRWKDIYWRGSLDHRYARIDINNGTDAGILFYANQGTGSNGQMKLVSTSSQEGLLIRDDGAASYGLDTSAIMQLVSTSRGFLPPKMTTTQRDSITTPTSGLIVYDTSLGEPHYYNGSSWISLEPSSGVTGSGTNNTIPIWNGSQTLTDSILTYDGSGEITVLGSVNITGNVEVLGTATTINTQNLNVVDNDILLNSGGTHTSAIGGGIFIEDGISNGNDSTWTINSSGEWSANTSILTQGINVQSGAMQSGGTDLYSIFTTPGNSGIYGGSGTVPSGVDVTLTDSINFDSNTFVIDGTNNRVGIGTNAPSEKLHVAGTGGTYIEVSDSTSIAGIKLNGVTGQDSVVFFEEGGSNKYALYNDAGSNVFRMYNYNAAETTFYVGDTDNVARFSNGIVVNEDGNDSDFRVEGDTDVNLIRTDAANDRVGIGTGGPAYKLEVIDTTGSGIARFRGSTSAAYVRIDSATAQDSGLIFSENGSSRWLLRNDASGGDDFTIYNYATTSNPFFIDGATNNVGIGTTNPNSKLQVSDTGSIASFGNGTFNHHWINVRGAESTGVSVGMNTSLNSGSGGALIKAGSNKNFGIAVNNASDFSAITESDLALIIETNGNVGIGTSSPAYHLEVTGTTNIGGPIYSAGTELSTLFASAGGGGIYDGNGTVPSSVSASITDTLTFTNGTVVSSNSVATSLSEGSFWANASQGAILMDGSGQKRISWNDGGGNFNIRSGSYYNGGEKYTNNGGAVFLRFMNDSVNGELSIRTAISGSTGGAITWLQNFIAKTTETVINEGGDDLNFRVEGDTDINLIRTDAANDRVGIGTGTPDYKFHVSGNIGLGDETNPAIIYFKPTSGGVPTLEYTDGTGFLLNGQTSDKFQYSDGGTTPWFTLDGSTNRVGIGTETPSFELDVESSDATWARINSTTASDSGFRAKNINGEWGIYAGGSTGSLLLRDIVNSSTAFLIETGSTQNSIYIKPSEVVINEGSGDVDFRVEGNGNASLIRTDAANDRVGIAGSPGAYTFDVSGTMNADGPIYSGGTELSTLFASAGGGGIYDGSGTVPSSTNVTLTDDITFGSGTVKLSNSTATSLTSGALWANGTSGAIIFDNNAEKRLYWNDGGGNFGLRAGHYYNSGEKYVKTGDGAVEIEIGTDSQNGNIILQTSTTGTAGATVSWVNRMDITTSQTVINELGNDIDFRVEGLSDTNLIVTDAANDRVGIGGTPGAYKFDVSGSLNSDGIIYSAGTPLETIISNISSVSDTNFANTNLTVSGTRIHDTGGNVLIWSSDGGTLNDFAIGFGAVSITFGHNNIFLEGSNNDMSFQDGLGNRIISFTSGNTVVNGNSQDIDFRVEGQTDANLFFTDAANDRVGIGTATPEEKFEVSGNTKLNGQYYFMSDGTVSSSPGGYGDIVTFGTGALSAGTLYYLNSSQAWVAADADAASSSTGMLGIALGTSPSDGILIRGFARSTSYTQTNGSILYVSTTAGGITSTAPSAAGDIVRIIGYMVNDASDVIYFNPSNDWIEL